MRNKNPLSRPTDKFAAWANSKEISRDGNLGGSPRGDEVDGVLVTPESFACRFAPFANGETYARFKDLFITNLPTLLSANFWFLTGCIVIICRIS